MHTVYACMLSCLATLLITIGIAASCELLGKSQNESRPTKSKGDLRSRAGAGLESNQSDIVGDRENGPRITSLIIIPIDRRMGISLNGYVPLWNAFMNGATPNRV